MRQGKNWSQAQFGMKMGTHQKQVSAYERGRNIPFTEVLMKIADIFDVSLDKGRIIEVLDTFIMKNRFQSLAVQKEL